MSYSKTMASKTVSLFTFSQVNTAHVSSFVLISILRGQTRTPPGGENLGVLDYHLKDTWRSQ